ncbi:MAG: PIN domain-containing protein [Chloroflexi bacterium]|nr:PIN domain-containing protein [Chloroflexota bacterium]
MRAYVDSDILIWHLRGSQKAASFLRALSREPGTELWVGALQRAEVVFFMRPDEVSATMSFLSRFKTAPVTQEVVDDAGDLYRTWHPTHGIDVNDAMLAATVAATGGKIYTLNAKHYPMPDIVAVKAW